ncbi:CREG1 PROTEIN [Salix purpurea]|uniref:CREG1 PROTEIN n=1 Tax=Salix purpurea TaxID=77065 RepID=A0A9Q0ZI94_SALPP|nr:CREG1 PROTEIN [Salix purpurea]
MAGEGVNCHPFGGIQENKFGRLNGVSFVRRSSHLKSKIQASAENSDSNLDSSKQNGKLEYHPSEGIGESTSETSSDAMLTPQETCRTIVEAKSKATLMLTGVINDDIHENIIWPDLPYVTDEHGNIYFQVKNDEDILQTLTTENNFVQAIIGFDATEMLSEMEALGTSEIDFGIEEIEEEDSDVQDGANGDDDDYDEDLVAVLDDDEEGDSDEDLGDWAKLETMSSSHPMYFAKKLAEVASDDPIDWMEQPPAGLAIQGLIRPAFMEEQSDIQRHMSVNQSRHAGTNQESEKDEATSSGTSFYKLEMIKIQLISAHGHQTKVEVEDFRKAQPDAIALSAAKIISRLKAGGEKTMQAFKSLCWRCKGIQVEEAAIIDVDSLGFGLRVCSGTQIQTLRFAFNSRATSEYSAERQLNDLLFPRIQSRLQKKNIAKMP